MVETLILFTGIVRRMFDVVEIDAGISEELRKEIKKDGVVIYEKA